MYGMGDSITVKCSTEKLSEAMDFLREGLKKKKVPSKEIAKTLLTSEEVFTRLVANAPDSAEEMKINIGGILGNVEISFRAKGTPFEAADIEQELLFEQEDEEANAALRKMINKILGDNLQIKNSGDVNTVVITVRKSHYAGLVYTVSALVLGILTGLLIQHFCPEAVSDKISSDIFIPIYTVFMNTLKFIVAPLVFFSIASSIADFGDIKAFGRIALKVVILYVLTSAIAICIGYLAYRIFPIGDTSLEAAVSAEAAESTLAKGEGVEISIKDTLVGIVPSDIVTPFQKSDMLQIIFIAVTLGLAASALSQKFPLGREILATFNAIFSKITSTVVIFIPLIVFCSMAKMMIAMDIKDLLNVFVWLPVIYFGDLLMMVVYILLLLLFTGLNPFKFLKKYYPAMVSAFVFASSNVALPTSIKQCDELGISPKAYSFTLPMGATINMDGSCITLMITALFFSKIFGIHVNGSVLLSLFIAIIVLSLGSPGIPGGNLVCIALLVPQIGIPAEAISLIMGLYPLVGMMQTCANVTGDAVVTTIVAKREKLLDVEKFNS